MRRPAKPVLSEPLIRTIFEQIAAKAGLIDEAFYHQEPGDDESDLQALEVRLMMIRALVSQIGAVADFGARELGGMAYRDGLEGWLLSPVYRDQKALIESIAAKKLGDKPVTVEPT